MFLPAEMISILGHFTPVFKQPTYKKALVLFVEIILTEGRRTFTNALRAVGKAQDSD